jgi:hypothetical protein
VKGYDSAGPKDSALPDYDVHASVMDLPGLLGTTVETIPADIPYLHADAALTEFWKQELSSIHGFRIGIMWQGNPKFRADAYRKIRLSEFAPLANVEGVRLISLQKGHGFEQIKEVGSELAVVDLGARIDKTTGAFMDTAAIVMNLDLVIASDSALVHLAGALGRPVWTALPFVADWRWLLDRDDTPWYPTMRLFRQSKQGDWKPVFERMAAQLKVLISGASASPS